MAGVSGQTASPMLFLRQRLHILIHSFPLIHTHNYSLQVKMWDCRTAKWEIQKSGISISAREGSFTRILGVSINPFTTRKLILTLSYSAHLIMSKKITDSFI